MSIAQLRAAGLSDTAVRWRTKRGRLHRLHRGVYAVGHVARTAEQRWMAATLSFSGLGVVSHRSAAELWDLLPRRAGPVEVTLRSRHGRRARRGLSLHRSDTLRAGDVTRRLGIPVTSVPRTLADLRGAVSPQQLRRATRQAQLLGPDAGGVGGEQRTRSELEEMFLALCRRHRLPAPEANARITGLEVDFLWPKRRLVVETDGYRFHRGSVAFEADRERDLRLRQSGFDVIRLTFRQVRREPKTVAALLRRELTEGV